MTRVAIVTGSASGVGLATVSELLSSGHRVVGMDIQKHPEFIMANKDFVAVQGDVSKAKTWQQSQKIATELFGQTADVVVHCAAKLAVGTVLDSSLEVFHSIFDVNVGGAIVGLQTCLPDMIQRGCGSVVVIDSVNGLFAEQGIAAYNVSKGALLQLVRSAALDHARTGVRINAVCPTSIDTPFIRGQIDTMPDPAAFWADMEARHPMGRILKPEEVARVATFLASDAASGMTGSVVTVDCGLTAGFDFIETEDETA